LFNLRGEVVGVNSQIFSRTGGYMGLSFAIPVDLVATVTAQLRDGGVVRRGWLGVLIQDVTSELAQSFGMPSPRGALVSKIVPDGPAANAGLRAGDVIVTFNGTPVDVSAALPPLVGASPIGSRAVLEVVRAGKTRRLTVHIGELPSSDAAATPASTAPANSVEQQLGLIARDPAPRGRERTAADPAGVVVVEVEAGPARDAGIRRGDLITLVDNEKIRDLAHLRAILARLPAGKSIPVLVQREGSPLFLALKMRANP
jgi:serine protease Do